MIQFRPPLYPVIPLQGLNSAFVSAQHCDLGVCNFIPRQFLLCLTTSAKLQSSLNFCPGRNSSFYLFIFSVFQGSLFFLLWALFLSIASFLSQATLERHDSSLKFCSFDGERRILSSEWVSSGAGSQCFLGNGIGARLASWTLCVLYTRLT